MLIQKKHPLFWPTLYVLIIFLLVIFFTGSFERNAWRRYFWYSGGDFEVAPIDVKLNVKESTFTNRCMGGDVGS